MKATTVKHYKPKSGARLHFTEYADEGGVLKARCNLCPSGPGKKPWDTVVNATRMAKHLKERHRLEVKPEDTETEPEVEPRSPPQPLISSSPSPFSAPSSPSSSFVNPSPGPAHSSAAEPSQPALKKPKKSLFSPLGLHFDRQFTQAEQAAAERAQALQLVMNGYSYNSQQRDWTVGFHRSLRSDYAYILEKHINSLQ